MREMFFFSPVRNIYTPRGVVGSVLSRIHLALHNGVGIFWRTLHVKNPK